MSTIDIIENLFLMVGGIAVFMYGIKLMGDSLENFAGNKMRKLLGRMTSNPIKGVGVGATVTAIIHSSSAVTVMVVGFVNVGLMNLNQAAAIIMGANIGTTITAQIMAISGIEGGFNITSIIYLLSGIGLMVSLMAKRDKVKVAGGFVFGTGLIFVGLDLMSGAMSQFRSAPAFIQILKYHNPIVLLLAGVVITAIIQSSAAMTGIVLALAGQGMLGIANAFYIILGANIGTCITAIMASMGASANGKRAATIHLFFNVIGAAIFFVPMLLFENQVHNFFVKISGNNLQWQISNFHTLYNVSTTLILLPFIKQLVALSNFLVKDKAGEVVEGKLTYLDERMLETPSIAVANLKKEIVSMANLAFINLKRSIDMLLSGDLSDASSALRAEEHINFLNKEITAFLVKISSKDITDNDEKLIGSYYHVVSDIERIGDYAENMVNFTEKMQREEIAFSDEAKAEIADVFDKITDLFNNTIKAFEYRDTTLLKVIIEREDEIDESKRKMSQAHIERLHKGLCTPESGAIYLSISSNLERIADHMTNIAYSTKVYNAGGTR